jgi:uncharacterized protein YjbJ (UPF0337 family)
MNTDQTKGTWKQFVGKAKETWERLTDDDWKVVEGKRDRPVGKIQERYGIDREEAERQVSEFERNRGDRASWSRGWASLSSASGVNSATWWQAAQSTLPKSVEVTIALTCDPGFHCPSSRRRHGSGERYAWTSTINGILLNRQVTFRRCAGLRIEINVFVESFPPLTQNPRKSIVLTEVMHLGRYGRLLRVFAGCDPRGGQRFRSMVGGSSFRRSGGIVEVERQSDTRLRREVVRRRRWVDLSSFRS